MEDGRQDATATWKWGDSLQEGCEKTFLEARRETGAEGAYAPEAVWKRNEEAIGGQPAAPYTAEVGHGVTDAYSEGDSR